MTPPATIPKSGVSSPERTGHRKPLRSGRKKGFARDTPRPAGGNRSAAAPIPRACRNQAIAEEEIAGKQPPLLLFDEGDMIGGVAGRGNDPKAVLRRFQRVGKRSA